MEKYAKYRISGPQPASSNKWEKYKISPSVSQQGDSWPSLIGKSLASGAASLADIPQGVASILEAGGNPNPALWGLGNEEYREPTDFISSLPPVSSKIKEGIKNYTGVDLEPHPTTPEQRTASKAAEFAGSFGPIGLAGKGAQGLNLLQRFNKGAKAGATIGAASGLLQERGVNPLVADLTASVATPTAPGFLNNFKKAKDKSLVNLLGLSPKNFKLETAKAAKDLGIDLPAAALTDSTSTALANQYVGKTPVFGNFLKKKYANAEKQAIETMEDIYNSTGPLETENLKKTINKAYERQAQLLPADASITPDNTLKAIQKVKERIQKSIAPSDQEKKVFNILDSLENNIALKSSQGAVKIPTPIDRLVAGKKSLNSTINWDTEVRGVKNALKKVQHAMLEDIKEYGKNNKEWYQAFQDAERLFEKSARRRNVEDLLSPAIRHDQSLSYPALSKAINEPENLERLKRLTDKETFAKIQKLGEVARQMNLHSKNIPNPSGTAVTSAIGSLVYGLAHDPISTLSGGGIAALIGAPVATKLLTDKRFVDLAIKYAENPKNLATSAALNSRIKEITGYSALSLSKALSKQNERREE